MKVKVADYVTYNDLVFINGYTSYRDINKTWYKKAVTITCKKDLFEKSIELPITFPLEIDVKFKKGIGVTDIKCL